MPVFELMDNCVLIVPSQLLILLNYYNCASNIKRISNRCVMQAEQQHNSLNFIDCHSHLLDYPNPQTTIPEIIRNATQNGIKHIVINTTTTKQFKPLMSLINEYKNIKFGFSNVIQQGYNKNQETIMQNGPSYGLLLAGFGIHPCFVAEQDAIQAERVEGENWYSLLQSMLNKDKFCSVGEIGLDFRKDVLQKNTKQLQMNYFKRQLDLAIKLQRPATIHCVRAHGQLLKILKELNKNIKNMHSKPHIIMHSYGGSPEITTSMLKLQHLQIYFSLSLKRSISLCSVIPIDKLVCETDSPCQNNIQLLKDQNMEGYNLYLTRIREQYKGKVNEQEIEAYVDKLETNQPVNIVANVRDLCSRYQMDFGKFTKILFENSLKAFKLIK